MIRGHFGSIHPARIALGAHEGPVSDKQAGPSLIGPRTLPRRAHEPLGIYIYIFIFIMCVLYICVDRLEVIVLGACGGAFGIATGVVLGSVAGVAPALATPGAPRPPFRGPRTFG